jgi:hypothetical protein
VPKSLSRLGWYMQLGLSRMSTTLRFSSFGLIADNNAFMGWVVGSGRLLTGTHERGRMY